MEQALGRSSTGTGLLCYFKSSLNNKKITEQLRSSDDPVKIGIYKKEHLKNVKTQITYAPS